MKTSSFSNYKGVNGVSIALYPPKWFTGRSYASLTPPEDLLRWWNNCQKSNSDWARYRYEYQNQVLFKLKPAYLVKDLGEDAVLLCWCKPGAACHRRIVADFLEFNLSIDIPEWVKSRTKLQNRSMHKYFTDLSNGLNDEGYTQRSFLEMVRGKLEIPVTYEFCKKIFLQVAEARGVKCDLRTIRGNKFLDIHQAFAPAIMRITGVSASLHECGKSPKKYLENLASKLDAAGHSQNTMFDGFKSGFDLKLDGYFIKEVFREVMISMTGNKSTTELSTVEMTGVFEAFDRAISEKTGVRCEWPCIDNMEKK